MGRSHRRGKTSKGRREPEEVFSDCRLQDKANSSLEKTKALQGQDKASEFRKSVLSRRVSFEEGRGSVYQALILGACPVWHHWYFR